MASLKCGITVKYPEYRPCLVCGTLKALFHRWSDVSELSPRHLLRANRQAVL